jgi:xylulokinase
MEVARSGIGQQAAALGAAVVAGVGCGVWKNFDVMESFSDINEVSKPDAKAKEIYQKNYLKYISLTRHLGQWAKEFEGR